MTSGQSKLTMKGIPRREVSCMKILIQIGIIFGLYWISQGIEAILPFPFPASVISMLVLLILLLLKVIKVEQIREKVDFVLGNLSFFFVPVVVSVMNYADVIAENAVALLVISMVSTVLTFGVTAWVVQWTCRAMNRRKGEEK